MVQNLASASSKSFEQWKETVNPRSVTFISAHHTPLMKAVRWRQRAFSALLSLYTFSGFQSKLKICSSVRNTLDDFWEFGDKVGIPPPCSFDLGCLNRKLTLQGRASSPSCANAQRKIILLPHHRLVTSLPSFTSTSPTFATTALTWELPLPRTTTPYFCW